MSLVSTYVQSDAGRWYKNPVIRGPDWFICWDDEEPIEVVIQEGGPSIAALIVWLAENGWEVRRPRKNIRAMRLFDGQFKDSRSWFIEQETAPPDYLLARKFNERVEDITRMTQGVYYPIPPGEPDAT